MESYNAFLEYYDAIVRHNNSPLDEEVDFLQGECIEKYFPDAKNVLELACGTWLVAHELVKRGYGVVGLDINKNMLERAQGLLKVKASKQLAKEEKKVQLIEGDMTQFRLEKSFDVVLCNYNSICHLLTWESWQACIGRAYEHLEVGGLFIFDINTVFEFENITRDFAQFYTFGDDVVCLEMFKKAWIYEWLVKIFKKSPDGRFDLIQECVQEVSFPISKIKKELVNQGFEICELVDFHFGEVTPESERVYFICRKGKEKTLSS